MINWIKKFHFHKWEIIEIGDETFYPFIIYDCDYPIKTIRKCTKCGCVQQLEYYFSGLEIIGGHTFHKVYTQWNQKMTNEHHDTIEPDNKAIQPHVDAIADYFKRTQAHEIRLQSGDVVITAKYGSTLDGLKHQHTFATYVSESIKKCVDCGYEEPLFDLEIKHQR